MQIQAELRRREVLNMARRSSSSNTSIRNRYTRDGGVATTECSGDDPRLALVWQLLVARPG